MPQNVTVIGTLARQVDFRFTEAGKPMSLLKIKCPAGFKRDGKEFVDWISAIAFDDAANDASLGEEGDNVSVMGRLKTNTKTGEDGKKTYELQLVCQSVSIGKPYETAPAD